MRKLPEQVVVDAGYTSRENVLALHEHGVTMFGRSIETDGRVKQRFARCGVKEGFLPEMFRFDASTNTFICPEGKVLRAQCPAERPGRTMTRYRARITDCKALSVVETSWSRRISNLIANVRRHVAWCYKDCSWST